MPSISVGSSITGTYKPIQVRAHALRDAETRFPRSAWQAFAAMHDDPAPTDQPTAAGWCDHDLKRAIAAAEEAGLRAYRVEIAPDGTIAIIVGE